MMTATDELRRLLDGRGVEYYPKHADETVWTASSNAHVWACNDLINGCLEIHMRPITPEQAVEATLGSDLKAENDKLREELAKWERLTAGINLPDYPVSQFVPKDIERENAKLRELVQDMWSDGMCECDERGACATCEYGYLDRMRELGIEVDT